MSEALLYYFKLQYLRFTRKCEELQVQPFLVVALSAVIFAILSAYVFYKTTYANWLYPLIALAAVAQLTSKNNYEDLRMIFINKGYQILRVFKAFLIAVPFVLYLLYETLWLQAAIVLILSLLQGLILVRSSSNFKIPTPFKKWPFEFVVGFRKSILLFALLYFLIFKAIQVGNPNLGYASLGFIFLLSMSFYAIPEDELFVWINANHPKAFLLGKIKIAIICSSIVAFPALLALVISFPTFYIAGISIMIAGYVYLSTILLAKYAAFPKEMNLPQALILGFSFIFPPMLFYSIPTFYRKAVRQLQPLLEC
jgi:hypothetical protein